MSLNDAQTQYNVTTVICVVLFETLLLLKTFDTFGNIVKDQSSHLVYLNISIK